VTIDKPDTGSMIEGRSKGNWSRDQPMLSLDIFLEVFNYE